MRRGETKMRDYRQSPPRFKRNTNPFRLRVVPHYPSGIVERAKRVTRVKITQGNKSKIRPKEKQKKNYRQSPTQVKGKYQSF